MSKIVKAYYGTDEKYIEVTNIINEMIERGNRRIFISNHTMRSDPHYGALKRLNVLFPDNKNIYVTENNYLTLDDYIAFPVGIPLSTRPSQTLGFIIIRCVRNAAHALLWKECYRCIRKFYDNKIIIIDDNSIPELVGNIPMINTTIVRSEHPGAGEYLPYYYLYKLKPFDRAVIFHDSMFITKKIDFNIKDSIKFMWHFHCRQYGNSSTETRLLGELENNAEILHFYHVGWWNGCFGGASVVDYEFVALLERKYKFTKLLNYINNRADRMAFERVIAVLAFYEGKIDIENYSFFGYIFDFCPGFSHTFATYSTVAIRNSGLIKVWSGR